jgi:DNA invertase Pin-like site-specific DNA recombinase
MEQMVGAFAEFERAKLRERTRAVLEAARRHWRSPSKADPSTAGRDHPHGLQRR